MVKKRKSRRRWYILTLCAFVMFAFYSVKYVRARTIIHKGVETKAIVYAVKGGTQGEAIYTDYNGKVHNVEGYIGKDCEVSTLIPLYYMGQKPHIYVVPDSTLLPKAEVAGVVLVILFGYSVYATVWDIKRKKELSQNEKNIAENSTVSKDNDQN